MDVEGGFSIATLEELFGAACAIMEETLPAFVESTEHSALAAKHTEQAKMVVAALLNEPLSVEFMSRYLRKTTPELIPCLLFGLDMRRYKKKEGAEREARREHLMATYLNPDAPESLVPLAPLFSSSVNFEVFQPPPKGGSKGGLRDICCVGKGQELPPPHTEDSAPISEDTEQRLLSLYTEAMLLVDARSQEFLASDEYAKLIELKDQDAELLLRAEQEAMENESVQPGLVQDEDSMSSEGTSSPSTAPSNKSSATEDDETLESDEDEEVGLANFHLEKVLGKGSYGTVFKVTKKSSGRGYAMKTISKQTLSSSANAEKVFIREQKMLQAIPAHPFCVALRYSFTSKDRFYLVMDYCSGGDLDRNLAVAENGVFDMPRVRFYSAELVIALEHLHTHNILYRDLKPENVLVDQTGHIKLADFGISRVLNQMKDHSQEERHATRGNATAPRDKRAAAFTFCGSPAYLSPEMLAKKGHGPEVDYFALGALVHEMLVGLPPFYSDNLQTMLRDIQWREPKIPSHLPKAAKSVIVGLLHKKPEKRLVGPPLRAHPFFEGTDWEALERLEVTPPFIPPSNDEENFFSRVVRGMFG